jgi:hypothetical protein
LSVPTGDRREGSHDSGTAEACPLLLINTLHVHLSAASESDSLHSCHCATSDEDATRDLVRGLRTRTSQTRNTTTLRLIQVGRDDCVGKVDILTTLPNLYVLAGAGARLRKVCLKVNVPAADSGIVDAIDDQRAACNQYISKNRDAFLEHKLLMIGGFWRKVTLEHVSQSSADVIQDATISFCSLASSCSQPPPQTRTEAFPTSTRPTKTTLNALALCTQGQPLFVGPLSVLGAVQA